MSFIRPAWHIRKTGFTIGVILGRTFVGLDCSYDGRWEYDQLKVPWFGWRKFRRGYFTTFRAWLPFVGMLVMRKERAG